MHVGIIHASLQIKETFERGMNNKTREGNQRDDLTVWQGRMVLEPISGEKLGNVAAPAGGDREQ